MTGLSAAWVAALDRWEDHQVVAGFTAPTRRRRRRYVEAVAAAARLADPWSATTGGLQAALAAAGLPAVSTRDARGALRAFYGWALASGRVEADPARALTTTVPPAVDLQTAGVRVRANRGRRRVPPPLPEAWVEPVQRWAEYCTAGGQSAATTRTRGHYLRALAEAVPDPWAATTEQLLSFLAVAEWSPETRRSARGTVRSFYAWAVTSGRLGVDPARALPAVRVPPAAPRPAPAEVVAAAYGRATADERLMLDLALVLGLRRAEVAGLHARDVEGDNLRVRGKGGRQRLLPLPAGLQAALAARGPGYVFPGHDGRPLSPYRVGDALSSLLGPGWSGHTLRHAAGTRWYAATGDVLVVSKLLGHARPETSSRYVQVPDDALRAAVMGRPAA